ncbi:glycosyltransferase family 61 protein (plasmid) [Rhizobium grahamii]|uniref:Glycosyltransferase family 61 protein n=1 Tax=Rhizobium grahamii TaxID=1120045 RepID=A0A5Q0CEN0_9HYPH|nr:glycosyltransferase family 61 protein [Rhizobium grahamii]QRM52302.1 glycosyltransferase family 61 protein [Rhizobium sp. BG6]
MAVLHYRNYLHVLRRKIGRAPDLDEIASRTLVVSPAERGSREAAIYLPNQLDRVREVQFETTREYEMARISAGSVEHAATLAYLIENAHYVDGDLYARGMRHRQVIRPASRAIWKRAVSIDECALPSTAIGDRYFAHHVIDDAATAMLADTIAPTYFARGSSSDNWPHSKAYYELFGLDFPVLDAALIRRAWVFQDYGMTANRRARITALRERAMSSGTAPNGRRIFISRKATGQRRLLENEAELTERLTREGFDVVDPARLTVAEIVERMSGASLICSVEGSNIAHGVLTMANKGAILTLQPPYRFANLWKDYADALDMTYGFVVGEGGKTSFSIRPDDVVKTADMLSAHS